MVEADGRERSYYTILHSIKRGSLRDSELFWNQIMMEHALFIRGLLDPSEDELINTADDFAADYKRLLEASAAANDRVMRNGNALALTQKFRDFKQAGVKGIEDCQIRSIILPLLADHVLREANHYIRLLEDQAVAAGGIFDVYHCTQTAFLSNCGTKIH